MEAFDDKLEALIPHSFIAKQQSLYFNECKASLKLGEVLVQADFSENYSFVLQDAAQGYHWNNSQATIHPFVVYYRRTGDCLLYTSPSPRDATLSRMPSSA